MNSKGCARSVSRWYRYRQQCSARVHLCVSGGLGRSQRSSHVCLAMSSHRELVVLRRYGNSCLLVCDRGDPVNSFVCVVCWRWPSGAAFCCY